MTFIAAGMHARHIGSKLGFSVLPKDTLTYTDRREPGFELPTHGSLDDLLYLLSHCP